MNAVESFFSMGGYGLYVWPAYAITFVVLVANVLAARSSLKAQKRKALQQRHLRQRRQDKSTS